MWRRVSVGVGGVGLIYGEEGVVGVGGRGWGGGGGLGDFFLFSMLCVPGYVLTSYLVDVEYEWFVGS